VRVRQPKMRASIEYAPGPSTANTALSREAIARLKPLWPWFTNKMASSIRQLTTAQ
jgi:hypothetical protein